MGTAVQSFSGTATVGTTEFSLPNNSTTLTPRTDANMFQVFVDSSAVALGDLFELNIKEKVTSGGAQRVLYTAAIVLGVPAIAAPTLLLMHGWDVTLKKLSGTDRSFSWSIRTMAA